MHSPDWLKKSKNEDKNDDWKELYTIVSAQLEGKFLQNHNNSTSISINSIAELKDELNRFSKGQEWLNKQFSDCRLAFDIQLPSPAVSVLKKKLLEFLQSCDESDDILNHEDARNLFFYLFDSILIFLRARIQMPSGTLNTTRYLMADYEGVAKEENLQDDLFEFLQTGIFSTNISYEPRRHAGGRADIKVTYINVNTVIELKKVDTKMTDEQILLKYGPQASTYQVADTNFCFLGVLDNYDNGGIQIDLRDSLSCHYWAPENGATRYSVILFRIQGKRRRPSDLSKRKVN